MNHPRFVAGVDSSTQSCKYIVVNAATGALVASTALPHPEGTALDPSHWWNAFDGVGAAAARGVDAISITAQQHTTILLDEAGKSVRDAILWNDSRAAGQAQYLRNELGASEWIREVGSLPTAAHPVSKLRWLSENEPANAERVHHVMMPHDWLTWHMLGANNEPTTDRSDASGTGYWSPTANTYRENLMELAFGRRITAPRVLGPSERAGVTSSGLVVGAGSGDNASTLLGLGSRPGEAVISVGTSLTVSMTTDRLVSDETGNVSAMADASGSYLPIVATLNGARTLTSVARLLGVAIDELDMLANKAPPDAAGLAFLPYLDGERTPLLPDASGALLGLTRTSMRPENLARAAVLGLSCAIASAVDNLKSAGLAPTRLTMVGGGAKSLALRQAVADMTGIDVHWPEGFEFAARGAARQAAWTLTGELPDWGRPPARISVAGSNLDWVAPVREAHSTAVNRLTEQLSSDSAASDATSANLEP